MREFDDFDTQVQCEEVYDDMWEQIMRDLENEEHEDLFGY